MRNDGHSTDAGILPLMPIRAFSLALLALAALSACGLRGPLYLPDDKQSADAGQAENGDTPGKPQRRPAPAPQSQKRDRGEAPAESGAPPDPDRPATVPVPIAPPGN
jgi:predicted small lipoprotein YifL